MFTGGMETLQQGFDEDEDRALIDFVVENGHKFGPEEFVAGIRIADAFRDRYPEIERRYSSKDVESRLLHIKNHTRDYPLPPTKRKILAESLRCCLDQCSKTPENEVISVPLTCATRCSSSSSSQSRGISPALATSLPVFQSFESTTSSVLAAGTTPVYPAVQASFSPVHAQGLDQNSLQESGAIVSVRNISTHFESDDDEETWPPWGNAGMRSRIPASVSDTQSSGPSSGECTPSTEISGSDRVISSASTPRPEPRKRKSRRHRSKKIKGLPHWDDRMGGYQLIVNNLAKRVATHKLRTLFERYGRVANVRMASTMSGRGYGFVAMKDLEEAQEAGRKLDGKRVKGKCLDVEWARPRGGMNRQLSPRSRSPRLRIGRSSSRDRTPSPRRSKRYASSSRSPTPADRYGRIPPRKNRDPREYTAFCDESSASSYVASSPRVDGASVVSSIARGAAASAPVSARKAFRLPSPEASTRTVNAMSRGRPSSGAVDVEKKPETAKKLLSINSERPLLLSSHGGAVVQPKASDHPSRPHHAQTAERRAKEPKTTVGEWPMVDLESPKTSAESGSSVVASTSITLSQRLAGLPNLPVGSDKPGPQGPPADLGLAVSHVSAGSGQLDVDAARVKKLMERTKLTAEEAFVMYIQNRSLYEKLGLSSDNTH